MKEIMLLLKKFVKWLVPEREAKIYVDNRLYAKCKITSITFDKNGKKIISGNCEVKGGKNVEIKNLQDKDEVITKLGSPRSSTIEVKYEKDYRRLNLAGKIALTSVSCFINNPLMNYTLEITKEVLFDAK